MVKRADALRQELGGGLFLSSMMGITDGAFCAQRSGGCAMVQLGAYLAEPAATAAEIGRDGDSFLSADTAAWTAFLAGECEAARANADVQVCLNLAALELEWALEAGAAFARGGGDLLELNAHGGPVECRSDRCRGIHSRCPISSSCRQFPCGCRRSRRHDQNVPGQPVPHHSSGCVDFDRQRGHPSACQVRPVSAGYHLLHRGFPAADPGLPCAATIRPGYGAHQENCRQLR